jgi:hypothetical protein
LYADTLEPYICADLIGKTLVEKAGAPVALVVTDTAAVLELRRRLDAPVAWLARPGDATAAALAASGATVRPPVGERGPLVHHPNYPGDGVAVRDFLERLDATFDLAEPFGRIREAIGEARKLGVGSR